MSATPPSCTVEFRAWYAETDQMGIIYHANYLPWCEIGHTELIRRLWRSYADLEAEGVLWPSLVVKKPVPQVAK
jgi:acyl-CoA thioester hydrolase